MSDQDPRIATDTEVPEAQVHTRRGLSIIWVVPIVALLIGGWLAYKAISEQGPVITIRFENAEGLEADKTKIKFKDVEIGTVTDIALNPDLSEVVVTAEMQPDAEAYLTENTRFWVVRARVAAGEVSGLETLLSGAYIGCSPSREGRPRRQFEGLENPPVMTTGQPGRHFLLEAENLGSLDFGSPVYYRGIKVGQVVEYDFDAEKESVLLKVFINAPYHEKVRESTRFWNASGINLSVGASGVQLDTQSLVSIMLGGIAFDARPRGLPAATAREGETFRLYPSREASHEDIYSIRRYYLMYFDQSVRGLSPGAPIEIKGIKVGEVVDVELQFDMTSLEFRIPVLVAFEPERISTLVMKNGQMMSGREKQQELASQQNARDLLHLRTQRLIDKGFRAQLKTANFLTGQLYIDLDYYPDAPPASLLKEGEYPVFPTVPAPLAQVAERVDHILQQLEQVPFDQIGTEIRDAATQLGEAMQEFESLSGRVEEETVPRLNAALENVEVTMQGLDNSLGPESGLSHQALSALQELQLAARSLRSLLDHLERNPQALLLGREDDQ